MRSCRLLPRLQQDGRQIGRERIAQTSGEVATSALLVTNGGAPIAAYPYAAAPTAIITNSLAVAADGTHAGLLTLTAAQAYQPGMLIVVQNVAPTLNSTGHRNSHRHQFDPSHHQGERLGSHRQHIGRNSGLRFSPRHGGPRIQRGNYLPVHILPRLSLLRSSSWSKARRGSCSTDIRGARNEF